MDDGSNSRRIYIGIPTHTGEIMVSTVISLLSAMSELYAEFGSYPKVYFRVGDSDLARARNAIIGRFMKEEDYTDLVLIDSDVSWETGALTRLIRHDQDFVAGAYRGRTDEKILYFVQWPDPKELWTDPKTGLHLLKVNEISIGFCRLRRSCVQKMVDSLNGHYYVDPMVPEETLPWLIDFERRDGMRLEEGYALCRKWRDLGGDVWVDPDLVLGHMGPKVFSGRLLGHIEELMNQQQSREMLEWMK